MWVHHRAGEECRNCSSVSFPVPEEHGSITLVGMGSLFLVAGARGRACLGSSSLLGTGQAGDGGSVPPASHGGCDLHAPRLWQLLVLAGSGFLKPEAFRRLGLFLLSSCFLIPSFFGKLLPPTGINFPKNPCGFVSCPGATGSVWEWL